MKSTEAAREPRRLILSARASPHNGQVSLVPHRVEICERRVPADSAPDIDRHDRRAGVLIQVVQVGRPGGFRLAIIASRHAAWSGVTSSGAKLSHAESCRCLPEVGKHLCGRPAIVARGSPAVVVGAASPNGDAAVMRRAAADHLGTLQCMSRLTVSRCAGEGPVVGAGKDTTVQ